MNFNEIRPFDLICFRGSGIFSDIVCDVEEYSLNIF